MGQKNLGCFKIKPEQWVKDIFLGVNPYPSLEQP